MIAIGYIEIIKPISRAQNKDMNGYESFRIDPGDLLGMACVKAWIEGRVCAWLHATATRTMAGNMKKQ